jgi:hypothetical protein
VNAELGPIARRAVCYVLAVAVLAGATPATPAGVDTLAVMVAVKGAVSVAAAKGGKPSRASLGRTLLRGDRVQVGDGGSATLFFSDGNVIELDGKSTVTVGGRYAATASAKGSVSSEVFAKVTRFVASDSHAPGLMALAPMRGASDEPPPMALSPRNTQVMNGRPGFRWRSIDGAQRYHVIVSGDQGDVWSRDVTATSLDYPAAEPALVDGAEFQWSVQAWSESMALGQDESTFSVMPDSESTRVSADLDGIAKATGEASATAAAYLAGSYLVGRGLYGDATERFEALVKIAPDAPGPHEALGTVYRTIGLTDLAAAEFKRALELAHTP